MINPEIASYFRDRMPQYLEMHRQMIEINSFTSNSEGINSLGSLTASFFALLGFHSSFIQSKNLNFGKHLFLTYERNESGRKNDKNAPFIAMISHLDTVFPLEEERANDFSYRLVGNRIYGPGSVDIKGGTVMVFMVLDAISAFYPELYRNTRWMVALDASEETLSEDFGRLCKQKIPIDATACLIFEGATPNSEFCSIVTSRKGRAEFRMSSKGRGAHAGNSHKQGANAIVQLAKTIEQVAQLTDYSRQLTFNVGVVHGGTVVNRVPHYAEAFVEMRAFSPDEFQIGITNIMALQETLTISSQDGFPCSVNVDLISSTDPWPKNDRTNTLFGIWEKCGKEIDIQVIPEARGGLSDGNHLWSDYPVLDGLGPSGMNAHCSEKSADGTKDQEYALLGFFYSKSDAEYFCHT